MIPQAYAIGQTVEHQRREWIVAAVDNRGIHIEREGQRVTLGWGEVFQ